ncbi:SDR family oxidoreductase [Polyangium spumosum]|uniref:SDR family NAD(P)-dependent oxidoreductase n=1 Tax=Polyangium spumosum TaxID=889282 RepID=A0A6N7PMP8_9BACT|nr:SDR family oxidoreductase [Polyangium spumosum]MRG93037.1 SDR family NAD(P)-dependent oxidoreductase [Polyangium spumosum]
MKMKDAIVLVTGSNRGLGRALLRVVLEAGARRVYAAARNPVQLEPLVAEARDRVVPLPLDITDPSSVAAAAAIASDVTVLINNAGVLVSSSITGSSADGVAAEFATNFFGTLAATKAFLPALERAGASGGAAVVNVLSIVSLANMPGIGAYSAAKAAAWSMTQALRAEVAKKNIRVHAALPGAIDTDMIRSFEIPKTSPEVVARGIVEGVEQGLDEILPDPNARDLFATWQRDPKALERTFASMLAM